MCKEPVCQGKQVACDLCPWQTERRPIWVPFSKVHNLHFGLTGARAALAVLVPGLTACLASVPQKWGTVGGAVVDAQSSQRSVRCRYLEQVPSR